MTNNENKSNEEALITFCCRSAHWKLLMKSHQLDESKFLIFLIIYCKVTKEKKKTFPNVFITGKYYTFTNALNSIKCWLLQNMINR